MPLEAVPPPIDTTRKEGRKQKEPEGESNGKVGLAYPSKEVPHPAP